MSKKGKVASWSRRALIVFFGLSLVLHIVFITAYSASQSLLFGLLATWTPNISAIVVIAFVLREEAGVRRLFGGWTKYRVSPWWYLAAVSPAVLVFALTGAYLLLGGRPPGPESQYSLPSLIVLAITIIFTGATGEELGWRGFALPRLQSRFSALTSSLVIGCWWSIWHVPGWIIMNDVPSPGYIASFMLTLIAQSVFITWLVNNTEGSVLIATLNHYAVNISSGLVVSVLGLITWDALSIMESLSYSVIAIALLFLYGPRRLMPA
ncbi:MAG: CPBP family intramembrane metalloprotease [Candidatus Bathyarchaeota archaeon]|nr:MAG: CPBP family intramembrane metalloprotease [Candidatus Bathyarchaeota archaeon]